MKCIDVRGHGTRSCSFDTTSSPTAVALLGKKCSIGPESQNPEDGHTFISSIGTDKFVLDNAPNLNAKVCSRQDHGHLLPVSILISLYHSTAALLIKSFPFLFSNME
jgi:hypothetical protein